MFFYTFKIFIACEDGDVRLRGGSHYREGRVEICRNKQCGLVCDDEWDEIKETRLLCVDNLDFQKKVYSHPEDWL